MKKVTLYTDGACSGNPGPGGWGAILRSGGHEKELSGGFRRTTNNRMELIAVIKGLEALKEPCEVTVVTDSQYIVNAMEQGWAHRWRANGWRRNKKEKALNPDLWGKLLDLCGAHKVRFTWIRGHDGHPENERCDAMSVAWSQRIGLPEDLAPQGPP
jgi:ribonuclease HI